MKFHFSHRFCSTWDLCDSTQHARHTRRRTSASISPKSPIFVILLEIVLNFLEPHARPTKPADRVVSVECRSKAEEEKVRNLLFFFLSLVFFQGSFAFVTRIENSGM
mmetsp:Transcript_13001/g.16984  ORF Transcript_13001/g.16984 Transcript_13001/m.16984 type:complete len:107 (+) Transcript_13001:39-359(+)